MGVEESGLTGMPHSCLSFRLTSAIATDGDGEMSGERRKQRTSGPLLMEKMKDGRSGRLLQVLEEDKKSLSAVWPQPSKIFHFRCASVRHGPPSRAGGRPPILPAAVAVPWQLSTRGYPQTLHHDDNCQSTQGKTRLYTIEY
jgi:hypothetical protein